MRKSQINMYQYPILKIWKVKYFWINWLKYRISIPKKITPNILTNLMGGYK